MTTRPPIAPRLLTQDEAAAYLNLPRAAMKNINAGRTPICGRVRWDRMALDAWLDEQNGLGAKMETSPANDDPEAAFDRSAQRRENAARHS